VLLQALKRRQTARLDALAVPDEVAATFLAERLLLGLGRRVGGSRWKRDECGGERQYKQARGSDHGVTLR
jgi:hypothetical protein